MNILNFKEFAKEFNLTEELIKSGQDILDNDNIPTDQKFSRFHRHVNDCVKKGIETGLVDGKPKKGSSRAVHFFKEGHPSTIDGVQTAIPHVMKIAFPGQLDKYNKSGRMLGEWQNMAEAEHGTDQHYSMLAKDHDGSYKTNPNGILAPVLNHHGDGHWLHMAKIDPIGAGDFRAHTKTDDFPKGISHDEFFDAVNRNYQSAYGKKHYGKTSDERLDKVDDHPLVQNAQDFCMYSGTHPGDFNKRNMGVWTHPVHGTKHIVLADYGFDQQIAEHYQNARRNQQRSHGIHY